MKHTNQYIIKSRIGGLYKVPRYKRETDILKCSICGFKTDLHFDLANQDFICKLCEQHENEQIEEHDELNNGCPFDNY